MRHFTKFLYSLFKFDLLNKAKKNSNLAGLEPTIFWFEVRRVIHYATGPHILINSVIIIYLIIESNGSLTYGPHGSSETPRAMFKM